MARLANRASNEERVGDLEQRLQSLEEAVQRLRPSRPAAGLDPVARMALLEKALEQDRRYLFQATAVRLREFQRRIGTEWNVLRSEHESAIAGLRRQADALAPSQRGRLAAIVALAVALLVVGADAGYLHWRVRDDARRADARIAALEQGASTAPDASRMASAEEVARGANAAAAQAAAQAALMIDVVSAPDTRRLTLLGDSSYAAAAGQALVSRTRGAVLSASGIPPAGAGSVYQVWLITSRGPVSLGFATPDARARISAAFDLPPGLPGSVTAVTVTRESAGGAAAPGAIVVLKSQT